MVGRHDIIANVSLVFSVLGSFGGIGGHVFAYFQYLLRRACLDGIGRRAAVRHNCLSAIVRRRCLTTSSMIGHCTCF